MKFIHTADIHWGMIPESDKPWGKKREQAIRLTFQGIIEDARDSRADLLLISGDLFHRQPLARDLKEVNYLFSTIPGVQVMIIAGNHDRIRPSSALMSFTWCPNVTFLMSEELSSVYFRDLNLEVHGFSYHTAEINEARLNGIKAPDDGRIHVLLAHGGDASHACRTTSAKLSRMAWARSRLQGRSLSGFMPQWTSAVWMNFMEIPPKIK